MNPYVYFNKLYSVRCFSLSLLVHIDECSARLANAMCSASTAKITAEIIFYMIRVLCVCVCFFSRSLKYIFSLAEIIAAFCFYHIVNVTLFFFFLLASFVTEYLELVCALFSPLCTMQPHSLDTQSTECSVNVKMLKC